MIPLQIVPTSIAQGAYKVIVNLLNARTAPDINAPIIQQYAQDDIIYLDGTSQIIDGYVWGKHIDNNSDQYIAVWTTNGRQFVQKVEEGDS